MYYIRILRGDKVSVKWYLTIYQEHGLFSVLSNLSLTIFKFDKKLLRGKS